MGACELIENETNPAKHAFMSTILNHRGLNKVSTLVHDDMCHFSKHVQKSHKTTYKRIKHWLTDKWHGRNHVKSCVFKTVSKADKAVEGKLNTSRAEQFNGWIRRSNFFLNNLRSSSHRFWVHRLIREFNDTKPRVGNFKRRTNAAGRALKSKKKRICMKAMKDMKAMQGMKVGKKRRRIS